ncbi:SHOCT domain-containing protein [Lacticaseibacillus salsurivasis]|uniref:SHOCT domain-containing protein n=1 Tax=Lacticaseibacillus salsurivasis TaxID=3081441 RepID=UPI0030C6B042
MGIFDKLTANNGLTPEEKQARKDAKALLKTRITHEQGIKFEVGRQLVGANGIFGDKMYQLDDRSIIFDLDDPIFFKLISVEFAGARYHEETQEQGHSDTNSKGKKKSHGLAGAIIGTALAPGFGTVAGAIVGGNSKKSKEKSTSDSNSTSSTRQIEDDSQTTITLKNIADGETVEIVLTTKTKEYQELRAFKVEPVADEVVSRTNQATNSDASTEPIQAVDDPIAKLREYKSLLDDGIISQDEFDAKKKEILGL